MSKSKAREDYQAICSALCGALQLTRNFNDLLALTHEEDANGERWVTVLFVGGYKKKALVTGDSGWAMIKDIIAAIK
ncbi:hypothetical protein [uncultured Phascolarctobacterium sp.]|uniref:hypothetical protein n=1 Tax=uncultured Phascolarctobacterium sp. TaxID=512296 RepID=UPI002619B145|nr:hypothetical protein [uncultured Phascolarctobacterium sp.]